MKLNCSFFYACLLLDAIKCEFGAILVVNLEVKRARALTRAVKFDGRNVREEYVQRWFSDKHKATLERIQESTACLERARIAFSARYGCEIAGHCDLLVEDCAAYAADHFVVWTFYLFVQLFNAITEFLFGFPTKNVNIKYFKAYWENKKGSAKF